MTIKLTKEIRQTTLEQSIAKTLEEVAELQVELIKYITKNKPGKFSIKNVTGEIRDVLICLEDLMEKLDIKSNVENSISEGVEKGTNNLLKYGFRPGLDISKRITNAEKTKIR